MLLRHPEQVLVSVQYELLYPYNVTIPVPGSFTLLLSKLSLLYRTTRYKPVYELVVQWQEYWCI